MTLLTHLLSLDRIECDQVIQSKKKVLEEISTLLAEDTQLSQISIYNSILAREKLGSTGLGNGIALPHGRISGLVHPILAIITLKEGIDFDAPDKKPVNIIIGLLVPDKQNEEHLKILAAIAEYFQSNTNINKIRQSHTPESILSNLSQFISE